MAKQAQEQRGKEDAEIARRWVVFFTSLIHANGRTI